MAPKAPLAASAAATPLAEQTQVAPTTLIGLTVLRRPTRHLGRHIARVVGLGTVQILCGQHLQFFGLCRAALHALGAQATHQPLRQDGIDKVVAGLTDLSEVVAASNL